MNLPTYLLPPPPPTHTHTPNLSFTVYNAEHIPQTSTLRTRSPKRQRCGPDPPNVNVADQIPQTSTLRTRSPKRQRCGPDPPNVNVADQIPQTSMLRTRSPFKLKLEIRVSVRISWENFNANLFFPINLNIFNNFHFKKLRGGGGGGGYIPKSAS